MSTAFYHRHDHAVIVFADTLQWTAALELVDTLDTLVELYFYALVELVVSSPGGEVSARFTTCSMRWRRTARKGCGFAPGCSPTPRAPPRCSSALRETQTESFTGERES